MRVLVFLVALFISYVALQAGDKTITKAEYPKDWVFTIDKARITCSDEGVYIVVNAKDVKYKGQKKKTGFILFGLNGKAKGKSKVNGVYKDGYDDISKIMIKGKFDTSKFISLGNSLCN